MGHIKSARTLLDEMQEIWRRADNAGCGLTPSERTDVQDLLLEIKSQKSIEDLGRSLGVGMEFMGGDGSSSPFAASSPGAAFIASQGYKKIKSASSRGQQWSSGPVEVALSMKGTLLEGLGSPGAGTGGGLVPSPMVVGGVVDKLFAPLVLEDLLISGVAPTNTVRYATQGTATSGAAGVAEGGLKPESTLAFSTVDEPVKKIATSITISDELLDDSPAVQTLINGQLGLFVRIESERQLLRGTSGGNEVQGLLTSRSVPVYAGGTAAGNKATQLFKAMNGMRGSAFVEPEWIVMAPSDWQDIRLLSDTAGQLFGGGPFFGPYGGPQGPASATGQFTGAQDTLWNKPVYLSAAIGAGTALIGNSQSAQVWNRGGLSVEATNSHGTNFTLNLSVIRAERRLALAVYRSNGFVEARIS